MMDGAERGRCISTSANYEDKVTGVLITYHQEQGAGESLSGLWRLATAESRKHV